MSHSSCGPLLPRLPVARALALEALEGRQCPVLCDCRRLGRVQCRLVDDALHHSLADAQESHGGGPVAAARYKIPGHGHHIRRPRLHLRISQDNRAGDPAGRLGAAVRQSGDQAGGAAEGHVPEQGQFDPPNTHLMTVSELRGSVGRSRRIIVVKKNRLRRQCYDDGLMDEDEEDEEINVPSFNCMR